MKRTLLIAFLAVLVVRSTAVSQDLQSTLNQLAGKAVFGYIDPISQGLLTNVNGGLFNKAPKSKLFGIDIEVGAALMYTPFGDLPKEFSGQGSFRFNKDQADDLAAKTITGNTVKDVEVRNALSTALQKSDFNITIGGPTVLGKQYTAGDPTSEVRLTMNGNVTARYTDPIINQQRDTTLSVNQIIGTKLGGVSGLADAGGVPFFAPQLTVGTLFGTKLTLRYVPKIPIPDIGDLSWTGFGIQHNLGYWFPIPVVDVAASFYSQSIKIDPLFEMKGTSFGLNVSKQFGFAFLNVTPYAGYMFESSTMTINYTPPAADFGPGITPPNINFEIEGNNTSRLVVGLGLRLLIININADYNIGEYNSMTAGISLAF